MGWARRIAVLGVGLPRRKTANIGKGREMTRLTRIVGSALVVAFALWLAQVYGADAAQPHCNGVPATITGAGAITGTDGPDVIVGSNGADTIDGLGDNDIICGLDGNDRIN